jgi:hypothetical protein
MAVDQGDEAANISNSSVRARKLERAATDAKLLEAVSCVQGGGLDIGRETRMAFPVSK